jgi:hypothetical protein
MGEIVSLPDVRLERRAPSDGGEASLWLAANWFRFPRSAPAPGTVAVKRHHVFVLERHIRGSTWMVYDANSGRHRTRVVDPRGDA